jgi:hypothetical protein
MDMMTAFALVALAATVFSLVGGISSMAVDGEVGHLRSEQWMVARVLAQAVAVLFVVFVLLTKLA